MTPTPWTYVPHSDVWAYLLASATQMHGQACQCHHFCGLYWTPRQSQYIIFLRGNKRRISMGLARDIDMYAWHGPEYSVQLVVLPAPYPRSARLTGATASSGAWTRARCRTRGSTTAAGKVLCIGVCIAILFVVCLDWY
jgi:hypothetical protein